MKPCFSIFQIQEDQLMWHGGFRARLSYILLQACDYASNNLPNITLPVLVLQGTEVRKVALQIRANDYLKL